MNVPVEVLEKILLKCDGKTLKTARNVCPEWKEIIAYLSQKTSLWEWCCKEEIPDKELVDYLDQYNHTDSNRWQKIYDNWVSWQNLQDIRYDIINRPLEVPRISCVAVSGSYIAIGSEDGRVRVYKESWAVVYHSRHTAVKVMKVTFIENSSHDGGMCLVIAYPRSLSIDYFEKTRNEPTILEDIKDHSIFKNYICYEKIRGRISIVKVCFNEGTRILMEIWFSRIYSPSYPTCLNIWNGICTLLIDNEVQTVHYDSVDTPPISGLERVAKLKSSLNVISEKSYQILRDDIIISLGKADSYAKEEFIEFFILGPNQNYSKKLFNSWEVLNSFITCIFVYGNTLVLGVDAGNVYFYHVSCWKYFDIRNYQKKIIIGRHPIISIDVKETQNERRFYVASTFSIHEIIGYDARLYL